VGFAVLARAFFSLRFLVEILSLGMGSHTRRRLWGPGMSAQCWTRECRRWAVPALQTCLRLSLTSVSMSEVKVLVVSGFGSRCNRQQQLLLLLGGDEVVRTVWQQG
jgi:hypothetical protein